MRIERFAARVSGLACGLALAVRPAGWAGRYQALALWFLAGQRVFAGEGVADAPGGGGSDALVDGQGLG
jgi:hypothetical protein